jgi:adenylate cyclase class 2
MWGWSRSSEEGGVGRETEIKVPVEDAEAESRRIAALGARLESPRLFEDNRLFDLPGLPLARSGRLLRVREAGGRVVVTAKGPAPGNAAFKVRREVETGVSSASAFAEILGLAGFEPVWRYQKFRRTYRLGDVAIVVDETPHGAFVEIEGEPGCIEDVARRLGYDRSRWSTETYREIHERACQATGIPCGDMVFAEGRPA